MSKTCSILLLLILFGNQLAWAEPSSVCEVKKLDGKNLFQNRCSTCHEAPMPDDHAPREWPGILNRMGPKAGLSPEEKQAILEYLQSTLTPGHK